MATDAIRRFDDSLEWQLDAEPAETVAVDDETVCAMESEAKPQRRAAPPSEKTPPPLLRLVEAVLFAAPAPLTAEALAGALRGVSAEEASTSVDALNSRYRELGRPYAIEKSVDGFRFALRPERRGVLERLYGGAKETRLTPTAIETLAVVAYRQPVPKAEVERLRGHGCGAALRQLLKRGLVGTRLGGDEPCFVTTPRFLSFFNLASLEELPRAEELPRL